jgi:uncharacterized membrane protein
VSAARSGSTDERGQTTVLIIGFVIVIAMTVAVVVDASAAYLRRQALSSLADGAALAAADGLQGEQVYTAGLGERAVVDPVAARGLVVDYLTSVGAGRRYPGLVHAVETDGDRVVVRVAAPLDLPIPIPGVGRDARVAATAAAVVMVAE